MHAYHSSDCDTIVISFACDPPSFSQATTTFLSVQSLTASMLLCTVLGILAHPCTGLGDLTLYSRVLVGFTALFLAVYCASTQSVTAQMSSLNPSHVPFNHIRGHPSYRSLTLTVSALHVDVPLLAEDSTKASAACTQSDDRLLRHIEWPLGSSVP